MFTLKMAKSHPLSGVRSIAPIARPLSRLLQSDRLDDACGGARAFDAENRLEARRVQGVVRAQQQAIALGLALLLELQQVSDRGLPVASGRVRVKGRYANSASKGRSKCERTTEEGGMQENGMLARATECECMRISAEMNRPEIVVKM